MLKDYSLSEPSTSTGIRYDSSFDKLYRGVSPFKTQEKNESDYSSGEDGEESECSSKSDGFVRARRSKSTKLFTELGSHQQLQQLLQQKTERRILPDSHINSCQRVSNLSNCTCGICSNCICMFYKIQSMRTKNQVSTAMKVDSSRIHSPDDTRKTTPIRRKNPFKKHKIE